jgi:membrane fusion protein (multidrug efflux system)
MANVAKARSSRPIDAADEAAELGRERDERRSPQSERAIPIPSALAGEPARFVPREVPASEPVAETAPEARRPLAPDVAAPAKTDAPPPKKRSLRKPIVLGVLAIAIAAAAYYGYDWWTNGRFLISTDDAYIGADTAVIAPKISGYVKSVPVDNNVRVTAGEPLLFLDDSDYQIALKQAQAQVAVQQAAIARIGEQIAAGNAQVGQAEAQLASAKAAAANGTTEYNRAKTLLTKTFGTQQAVDTAQAAMLQANAAVDAASAGVTTARANVSVLSAQQAEAERALDQEKLTVDKAQLDLDHATVRAPFDGVVGNRAAEPGEYVQPGTRLMAVVPLQNVYIDANFKETQLADVRPGQKATITVDAYPDRPIEATVESVAPASGAVFSLLPPDNATGNFTKIVQRVPVRLRVPASVAAQDLIRPGMSVVVDVDTRTGPTSVASR